MSCENGNELSSSIKGGEFTGQLSEKILCAVGLVKTVILFLWREIRYQS